MAEKRKINDALKLAALLALVVVFATLLVWLTRRDLLLTLIFFLALLVALLFITLYLVKRERRSVREKSLAVLEGMSGGHFAYFLCELFKEQGFAVKETVVVENLGADLLVERAGQRLLVQARRWKNNPGAGVVRQAAAAVKQYGADKGIVITNTYFTAKAVELARAECLELWDRDKLLDLTGDAKK